KNNITWLLIFLIPGLIYMVWRYSYFGYLLPNTYYAKTGSSIEYLKAGWDYFWEFAKNYGLYGALVAIILINLKSKERYYEYLYLIMIFFVFSVYVIIIGGDVLKPSRFFVPIVPLFYVLVQESIHQIINILSKKKTPSFSPLSPIIITIILAYITYKIPYESIKKQGELENGLVDKMKATGLWLKNKSSESGRTLTVAASTIGAISYFSDVNLIDMLGLTDKEIAHNPKTIEELSITAVGWKERNYNADYIISRKPDYIYFSTGIKPSAYGERALFLNDEFRKSYYAYYSKDVIYKRKSDSEISSNNTTNKNPNYSIKFIYDYVDGLNTMRDKTKLNEAINKFSSSIKLAPRDFSYPYQFIGEIYIQNNNKDKAFENFKKATEIDDYNVLSHYYLYQLYLEKGDSTKARLSIEKIQKYSPDLIN
ncbi:MAG: tetratricopeptide repeat protein, partial [Ignavibacteria bacterium]